MVHMDIIVELIESDKLRLNALACLRLLDLPECYIAAGFVRNLIWDSLHQKLEPTRLNDVDVIYPNHLKMPFQSKARKSGQGAARRQWLFPYQVLQRRVGFLA